MSESNRHNPVVSFPSGGPVQQHQPYNEQPEVRLSPRIPPVAILLLALPFFLWWAATIAFTPAGMRDLTAGLAAYLRFLGLSPDGNRVATFVMFALGLVGLLGFVRHLIVRHYGAGTFGCIEIACGVTCCAGALAEWHLGRIGLFLMLGLVWGGWILISCGWRNTQNNQGPTYVPQFQAAELPEQTVYGQARPALDDEIHEALRDRSSPSVNPGYRFRE